MSSYILLFEIFELIKPITGYNGKPLFVLYLLSQRLDTVIDRLAALTPKTAISLTVFQSCYNFLISFSKKYLY